MESRHFVFFPIRSGLKRGTNYNCGYSLVDGDSGWGSMRAAWELEELEEIEIPGLEKTEGEQAHGWRQSCWKVVYPSVAIVHTRI